MKNLKEFLLEAKKSNLEMYKYVVRMLHTKSYFIPMMNSKDDRIETFLELVKDCMKRFYPNLKLISDEENTALAKKAYEQSTEQIRKDYLRPLNQNNFITTFPMTKEGTYSLGFINNNVFRYFCFQHPNIKTRNPDGSVNEDAYNLNFRIYPEVAENLERMCISFFWYQDKPLRTLSYLKEEDIFDTCYQFYIMKQSYEIGNVFTYSGIKYFFPFIKDAISIIVPLKNPNNTIKKFKLTLLNGSFYLNSHFNLIYNYKTKIEMDENNKTIISEHLQEHLKNLFEKNGFKFEFKEIHFNFNVKAIKILFKVEI